MDLKGILSISGYPGLFKLVSQGKNNIIVESLEDKKRMPAYATSKISALEDIAIYTEEEEVSLKDVLRNIFRKENGGAALNSKAGNEDFKEYFSEILPNYDKNRVYVSDMKKVINWYNILNKNKLVDLKEPEKEPEAKTAK